jgi:hypothetical protein
MPDNQGLEMAESNLIRSFGMHGGGTTFVHDIDKRAIRSAKRRLAVILVHSSLAASTKRFANGTPQQCP